MMSLISCSENQDESLIMENELCSEIHNDSIVKIEGTLTVNSKGEYIFKSINHESDRRGGGTYLIPCNESLKKYVANAYDFYTHQKNTHEQFWIGIEGEYLTDVLKDEKDTTSFLFNYAYILEENEVQSNHKHFKMLIDTNWTSQFNNYCNYYHFNSDYTGFAEHGVKASLAFMDYLELGMSEGDIIYSNPEEFHFSITDTILVIEYLTLTSGGGEVVKDVFYYREESGWVSNHEYTYGREYIKPGERKEIFDNVYNH